MQSRNGEMERWDDEGNEEEGERFEDGFDYVLHNNKNLNNNEDNPCSAPSSFTHIRQSH